MHPVVAFYVNPKGVVTASLRGGAAIAGEGPTREEALLNLVWLLRDALNEHVGQLRVIRNVLGSSCLDAEHLVGPQRNCGLSILDGGRRA